MDKKELLRAVKFTLFSISAGAIQLLSFTALTELTTLPYWFNYLTALVLSVVWNFTLNRRFTFQSANNVPKAMAQVAAYYLVFTPISTAVGSWLAESLLWNEYLVTILNMLVNLVTEFAFDRFVVFGGSIDTNDRVKKDA